MLYFFIVGSTSRDCRRSRTTILKKLSRKIPEFNLYGEAGQASRRDRLHIEDIQSRSRRYRWEIAAHTHNGLYQCLYVHAGPVQVHVDEQRRDLQSPAFVLVPPGTVHAFRFSAGTEGYVLTLTPDVLFEHDGTPLPLLQAFAVPHVLSLNTHPEAAQRLRQLCGELLEEFRQPDSEGSPLCTWLARCVLWRVARELVRHRDLQNDAPPQQRAFLRFRSLLEAHFLEHWPISRYAKTLGLTEGQLNRRCLQHSGHSAFRMLQDRLALEARRRLIYIAQPIGQIAAELGFEDPAYFTRFFRRHTGRSPQQFRRAQERDEPPG
ncbi:MAG: helix-turn-helix domain-containing protein [Steroidobacteraceae bacterium]